jgi:hypothetical protein
MHGKVVDINGGSQSPGAKVIVWPKKSPPAKNQLWYCDQQGFIRSALNDMVFSSYGKGSELTMQPPSGDPRSQWMIEGGKIGNRHGECLDISRNNQADGAELISWDYRGSQNQNWRVEYI